MQNNKYMEDFYVYNAVFGSLAAAAVATANINIQADADFKIQKVTVFSELAGAAQTDSTRVIPLLTVQLTDTGSGRQLMDAQVPISNIAGTGQIPFILSQPKIIAARSVFEVNITNVSAGTTYANTWISFIGVKMFQVQPGR